VGVYQIEIGEVSVMEFIKKAWAFLKGKKSYIVGGLMIILGLLNKDDKMILEGLGLLALRNAL
jgi:hypothetical protein